MARYYFHLRDSSDALLDPEGRELADVDAAEMVALGTARDILSHDIRKGRVDLRYRIEVEDESGCVVHALAFGAAFGFVEQE